MSTLLGEPIDVDGLVPDGIEPVEMFRVWNWDGKALRSMNGAAWPVGAPLKATCRDGSTAAWEWKIIRYGLSLERARDLAERHNRTQSSLYRPYGYFVSAPSVALPDGYGYSLERTEHNSPDERCTCGIYAASDTSHGYTGNIWGKVKMWGRVVPGEKGARAEYAYPSELHVPAHLASDSALLAYGVPVIVDAKGVSGVVEKRRGFPWLHLAVGVNLGGAAANLTLAGLHVVH